MHYSATNVEVSNFTFIHTNSNVESPSALYLSNDGKSIYLATNSFALADIDKVQYTAPTTNTLIDQWSNAISPFTIKDKTLHLVYNRENLENIGNEFRVIFGTSLGIHPPNNSYYGNIFYLNCETNYTLCTTTNRCGITNAPPPYIASGSFVGSIATYFTINITREFRATIYCDSFSRR